MFFIAYTFKGQVHVFAGRVKIVSHSSCRTSTILKYFCPLLWCHFIFLWIHHLDENVDPDHLASEDLVFISGYIFWKGYS